jgi:hypothetical protein
MAALDAERFLAAEEGHEAAALAAPRIEAAEAPLAVPSSGRAGSARASV